jgi:GrpB-like predicted nucleotidyltransferase (UPF0157 family)
MVFEKEYRLLLKVTCTYVSGSIEHIGSASVTALAAKPDH